MRESCVVRGVICSVKRDWYSPASCTSNNEDFATSCASITNRWQSIIYNYTKTMRILLQCILLQQHWPSPLAVLEPSSQQLVVAQLIFISIFKFPPSSSHTIESCYYWILGDLSDLPEVPYLGYIRVFILPANINLPANILYVVPTYLYSCCQETTKLTIDQIKADEPSNSQIHLIQYQHRQWFILSLSLSLSKK